jgi:hypothetical protein
MSSKARLRGHVLTAPFLTCCALLAYLAPSATFADTNANVLIQLFNSACVQNMGHPDDTRRWAADNHLTALTHPDALKLFVGDNPVGKGAAWNVPSATASRLALSLRGMTEACTVYAEQADAGALEKMFLQEIIQTTRPGIEVRKDSEKIEHTRVGTAKQLVYIVTKTGLADKGYEFILTTAEHPGGPYQASIQVAPVSLH